jgi:hypothetical protein
MSKQKLLSTPSERTTANGGHLVLYKASIDCEEVNTPAATSILGHLTSTLSFYTPTNILNTVS